MDSCTGGIDNHAFCVIVTQLKRIRIMPRKKKHTYIVNYKSPEFYKSQRFEEALSLEVVEINGKTVSHNAENVHLESFPNPSAFKMLESHEVLKSVMGARLASTIVEYLDKETYEIVAVLFPMEMMYNSEVPNFMDRLNHVTKKDLRYQIKRREMFLRQLEEKQHKK